MDRDHEPSSDLLRLKILIWVHSTIGAALGLAFIGVVLVGRHEGLAVGLLACLVGWMLGFGSLRKKASELGPEDRAAPKGLPVWIPPLVWVSGFLSPLWLASPLGGLAAAAWLLLAGTIALRWVISRFLAIPVHRSTWRGMLVGLSIGLLWVVLVLYFVLGSMGA